MRLLSGLLALVWITATLQAAEDPAKLLARARKELAGHGPLGAEKAEADLRQALRLWDKDQSKGLDYADASVILAILVMGREHDNAPAQMTDALPFAETAVAIYQADSSPHDQSSAELAYDIEATILRTLPDKQDAWRAAQAKAAALRDQVIAAMQPAVPDYRLLAPKRLEDPVKASAPSVSVPKVEKKFDPDYSEAARITRLDGKVLLRIVVGTDGDVVSCKVIRGLGFGLDEQACRAVLKWKFSPGLKDGVPVPVSASVEVSFRLL